MPHVTRSRVRALPAPQNGPTRTRSLVDAEAVAVLHRSAQALLDDLPGLTDRVVVALRDQVPAYHRAIESDPTEIWQEVHCSLEHNVGSLIRPRETRDEARRTSWRIGVTRAKLGVPLDAMLHAFRIGGATVWQGLVDETARRHPEDVRLLIHVAADVWNFVDEHCGLAADAYRQTERRIAWRRDNRLRLLTGALLDGTARIADVPDAAAALSLPARGRYAVLVVAGVRAAPRGVAAPPLTLPPGTRAVWHRGQDADYAVVLLSDTEVPPAAGHSAVAPPGPGALSTGPLGSEPRGAHRTATGPRAEEPPEPFEPAALAEHLSAPDGARVGISSGVDGLAAVGEARALAETALRACPRSGGVILLDAHLPAALVVSSPELGAAIAARVLGPLARLDPTDRDVLIDTLVAWFDADGSAQRAGARLYCHRNTVLNRLRRFEQLTGRCLARPSDAAEVSLALTARRLLAD